MKQGFFSKMALATAIALSLASGAVVAKDKPADVKKEVLYPNATRTEPKSDLKDQKDVDALNAGQEAATDGDLAKANEILGPLADGSKTKSKYAQAIALQALATLNFNSGSDEGKKKGLEQLKQALDVGAPVVPNDTYYQLKYMYAQLLAGDEQYAPALQALQQWRAEGKRETAESYGLEGSIDYRLEKYPEAIAAITKAKSMPDAKPQPQWDQILMASYSETGQGDKAAQMASDELAKNPSDATALNNATSSLIQAQKYPEAIALMEKAHTAGAIKDEKQYVNFAKIYLIDGQNNDSRQKGNAQKAAAILKEGMDKGVVQKTGENYNLLADSYITADDMNNATAALNEAVKVATNGEPALKLARVNLQENKYAAAEKAATDAISKGVQHKGQAYMVRAEAKRGQKNKQGAIADMKLAAQDPETSAKANAWLKTAGNQ
ncbi:tetratricopeptide repeat protein [Luteibacter sp.]|uniref:tetratricopeptide repeat protein n=1 Tax=Luteibacter sp. TaxID=1886636 RepID=UPI003F7E7978